jgi:serine kinase of HPr protein (carbohydrate metabolism regulator)
MSKTVAASAVVYRGAGILIRGAPGSGKSTLALTLIEDGGRLVGDDRIHLGACHGRVIASGHGAVAGQIELRGRGLVERPFEPSVIIALIVDLVPPGEFERAPEPDTLTATLLGVPLPRQPVAANSPCAARLVGEALDAIRPCTRRRFGQDGRRITGTGYR